MFWLLSYYLEITFIFLNHALYYSCHIQTNSQLGKSIKYTYKPCFHIISSVLTSDFLCLQMYGLYL